MWSAVLQGKYRRAREADQAVVERCVDRTIRAAIE
jgi:hypothetical protein